MPEATASSSAQVDEQRIAKLVKLGLPAVTLASAAVVGVMYGVATSLLVIAAGLLLGVIALIWGSLRILSGDAPLAPELEELDLAARGEDALSARKTMLLRALKDLENERGIGKIEDEDYEQIAAVYRNELKGVMKKIDESLAPHRERAEELARSHLARAGLMNGSAEPEKKGSSEPPRQEAPARVLCSKCSASNEPDAKFCKECATPLDATTGSGAMAKAARSESEVSGDQ
jgi:hypothetical protein